MPLVPKITTVSRKLNQVQLHSKDAIKFLESLIPNSIDLMITDPPYESLEKHRKVGTTTRLQGEWFPVVENGYFIHFFPAAYKVMKDNTHTYLLCDQETMFCIVTMAKNAGFKFCKFLVWDKMAISTGYHWRNSFECILFFEKGKRRLNNNSWGDIQHIKRLKGKQYYPTQKPVELLERLIVNSSNEGETVIDPFMGAGSTGVAAINQKRLFIGNDVLPATVEQARRRIAG